MIQGQRIKERMAALGISQAELARRVGIKQPSVHALVSGVNKRGSAHLHLIARELGTTPAYLTGETDDPLGDRAEVELSAEEAKLLEIYRELPKKEREALKLLMKRMISDEKSGG